MRICVFCGSSDRVDQVYLNAANELGMILSKKGIEVYYGAGNTGLMGALSTQLLKNNCIINGVIPNETSITEMVNLSINKIYSTNSLFSRKNFMLMACDVFIVLPGGIGTVDEFFDVISSKQICKKFSDKKCILINVNGYFDYLLAFLEKTNNTGFTSNSDINLFNVINQVQDIHQLLECQPT